MQKPAGKSLLQEWRKLSQELHGKGVGKDILIVPRGYGEHVGLNNISDEGCWIESKHEGEVGEQQKEKPVKCCCAEEKSMVEHGGNMEETTGKTWRRHGGDVEE